MKSNDIAKRREFPLRTGFVRQLPSFLKSAAQQATNLGAHFALACLTRRFPVVWLRGRARLSGQQATLLVAGKEPWVNYLPGRFFAGEPERELIGHASVWTLPGLLRRLSSSADDFVAGSRQFAYHAQSGVVRRVSDQDAFAKHQSFKPTIP